MHCCGWGASAGGPEAVPSGCSGSWLKPLPASGLDADHRCYGFFHFRLPDVPLIFVEVALSRALASSLSPLLDESAQHCPYRKNPRAGGLFAQRPVAFFWPHGQLSVRS
ncbi:MAG: malonyl-CoA decarboxylase domain-containing protein, partial [Limnohabitans sp.]